MPEGRRLNAIDPPFKPWNKTKTGKGNDKVLPPTLDNSERVNINQEAHVVENKEEVINLNYNHQTNIKDIDSLTYKHIAVQYKTSHHIVSTIHNNKHLLPKELTVARGCIIIPLLITIPGTTVVQQISIIINKEKRKIGIKYSIWFNQEMNRG